MEPQTPSCWKAADLHTMPEGVQRGSGGGLFNGAADPLLTEGSRPAHHARGGPEGVRRGSGGGPEG
eukprot:196319-Prorocentrum_minimum.AAC.2